MEVRKIAHYLEQVTQERGQSLSSPITKLWAAAVVSIAQREAADLKPFIDTGRSLGDLLAVELGQLLEAHAPQPLLSYGKAVIAGVDQSLEAAAAVLHPAFGAPFRKMIGRGKSIIPSTVKQGGVGASIDIPLHDVDDAWQFSQLDAITATVPDAPLPGELVVFMAFSCGGRPAARIGRDQ